MQLVSNLLVLLVLEAQVLTLEVLAVESEDGLLVATDEKTRRHIPDKERRIMEFDRERHIPEEEKTYPFHAKIR